MISLKAEQAHFGACLLCQKESCNTLLSFTTHITYLSFTLSTHTHTHTHTQSHTHLNFGARCQWSCRCLAREGGSRREPHMIEIYPGTGLPTRRGIWGGGGRWGMHSKGELICRYVCERDKKGRARGERKRER